MQASALRFLVKNGLNLTKLFVDGIPYLRGDEEKALLDKQDKFVEGPDAVQDILVEDGQVSFVSQSDQFTGNAGVDMAAIGRELCQGCPEMG